MSHKISTAVRSNPTRRCCSALFIICLLAVAAAQQPKPSGSLVISATDQSGAPISHAWITAASGAPPIELLADEKGVADLQLGEGDYRVTVKSRGFVTQSWNEHVTAGQTKNVSVKLNVGYGGGVDIEGVVARLKIIVVDAQGARAGGADVRAYQDFLSLHSVTDSAGEAQLDVPPGKYQVQVCERGFSSQTRSVRAVLNASPELTFTLKIDSKYLLRDDDMGGPRPEMPGFLDVGTIHSTSGIVTDAAGTPLSHVVVDEVASDWKTKIATIESDPEGHFSIPLYKPLPEYHFIFYVCGLNPVKVHAKVDPSSKNAFAVKIQTWD